MKYFILMFFIIGQASAAQIISEKSQIEFYFLEEDYLLDFDFQLECRYEKIVWSDSSEYVVKTKKVPVSIKKEKIGELTKVTLSQKNDVSFELTQWYRPTKECSYRAHLFLKSKKYSIGWANQFSRAIKLGESLRGRQLENQIVSLEELFRKINNKELSFGYRPSHSQVHVTFQINNERDFDMSSNKQITVALDKETQMPFPLTNK